VSKVANPHLLVACVAVALMGASQAQAQIFQRQSRSGTQSARSPRPDAGTNQWRVQDPGVRSGLAGAGGPLAGLTTDEIEMFTVGLADFAEEEEVDDGIGPRFNFVGCAGCHEQPAIGGTSPAENPLFRVVGDLDFTGNVIPSFIEPNGPIREVRFRYNRDGTRDGGVHALFVIKGHPDAAGCGIRQEDFEGQFRSGNVVFRIPTPTFGLGLVEAVPDSAITANLAAGASAKSALGISGRPNRNGNDGTISRFGWKAQNQSLLLFSGEAYNVEMGITNEIFQVERDETGSCQFATVPNDVTASVRQIGAIENFANFQRFLAPPAPVSSYGNVSAASIGRGREVFASVGCAHCHTPTLRTGEATVAALANRSADLYSDLALHAMGPGLADDVVQGAAAGDEFRTAPLWGLGQRIFLMHDGRTSDLVEAIRVHRSAGDRRFGPSEANAVIDRFQRLDERDAQHLLNFLRSL
jgi:CxxC motif-containing protein (DUF1111 family)